MKQGTFRIGNK